MGDEALNYTLYDDGVVGYEGIYYTLHGDGRVTVEHYPERIRFNEGLFRNFRDLDPSAVRLDGDRLYLACSNGHAVYVREGPDDAHGGAWWARLYGSIEEQK